jgi:hypothetical protein
MNVKRGDFAITFGAPMDNGILVEVLGRFNGAGTRMEYGPCWHVRSLGSPFHITPTRTSPVCVWPDKLLRPIRDPGDAATDESKAWLPPVPTRDPVEAHRELLAQRGEALA